MIRLIYTTSIYFSLFFILNIAFLWQIKASVRDKPLKPFATPPVIEANDADTADITVNCIDDVPAALDLTAVDDNDPVFPKQISPIDNPSIASLDRCTGGVITRRWIAVDMDNMSDTVTQIITILPDNKNPLPLIPEIKDTVDCKDKNYIAWLNSAKLNISTNILECNLGAGFINDNAPAIFTKNCGTVNVLFTISDQCGNDTLWNASYTIIDDEAPQLLGLPTKLTDTISCTTPIPPVPTVTVTDNCTPNLTATFTQSSGQTNDGACSQYNYTILRNWVVMDSCGNITNMTQRIVVQDIEAPTFTKPSDKTITCADNAADLAFTGMVTNLIDSCGGTPTLTYKDIKVDSICPYEYTIERSWTATDVCGNSSTRLQRIDVVDDQLPTFVIPNDTTVTCAQTPSTTVTGVPKNVADNCDPAPKVEYEDVIQAGTCINTYTVKRTWRVTDACGNINSGMQFITVKDTIAPVFTMQAQNLSLVCANNLDAAAAYNAWVSNHGGATATDNCTETPSLTWTLLKSGTTTPATFPEVICPAPDSVIRLITVDFIVSDECGNRDTTTASFKVIDDKAPKLSNCPKDTTIIAPIGTCESVFTLKPPIVDDECATSYHFIDSTIVKNITTNAASGKEGMTPVNAIEFDFPVSSPAPIVVSTGSTLSIQLNKVDAEAADEYFNVLGEDGSIIGRTQNSPLECDTSRTVLNLDAIKMSSWATDGVIKFRLVPNIPTGKDSSFAINAICTPVGTARGRLQLQTKNFTGLSYSYQINDAVPVVVNPVAPVNVTLASGENKIKYFAKDCTGATDSCSYTVKIEDREPPVLVCPDNILVPADSAQCVTAIKLPLPKSATDNCGLQGLYENTQPTKVADALLTFNLNTTLNTYQANEKIFTFSNVAANAVKDVQLTLDLLGDFNTPNAYFKIIGDDGFVLDSTAVGVATCTTPGQKVIIIPMAKFNTWASDGTVQIKLTPREPSLVGDGINPCDVTKVSFNGDNDSTSFVLATLRYAPLTPSFYATGATPLPLTPMTPPAVTPLVNFNVGETQVFYIIKDVNGNADTCSYKVTVEDKQRPIARCQPTTIFINPSGLDVETIPATVINAGSSDNCRIDTMFLTPNTFNCAQAETNATVTLTVVDKAGNTATCQSLVRIEAEEPQPTATSGLCGGDTLFLAANPPAATGGIIYTYKWMGPNGFSSTQPNPRIPNIAARNAGTYSVEVSGITGCKSIGTVQVAIEDLPLTPSVVTKANVCITENIVLNSSVIPSGSSVTYRWYRGAAPNGTLIGTTFVPSFTISQPHAPGTNAYYLIIEADGCTSAPSASFNVTANSIPTASVNDAEITVCEGETVTLGTLVSGPGITYEWSGPNNYASTNQFPPVINPITLAGAGVYRLVVLRNGCPSSPAFTVVNVKKKPSDPQLVNSGAACEGTNVTLSTTTTGASVYHWIAPNLQEFLTTTNQYVITNITKSQEGPWRLYVTQNGCNSNLSNATNVIVNTVPAAVASVNPMEPCEGNSFQLFASPSLTNATYMWTGPNNYVAATQNPTIANVTQAREGAYKVTITTPEGCSKNATVAVDVRRGVRVTGVSNDGRDCLLGPTDIRLRGTVFPVNDGSYRYRWTGPNFSSSDSIALIPNATQANNGNYQLVVTNGDGCASEPMTTVVKVSLPPTTPNAPTISPTTPAPYCEGKALSLVVTAYSGSTVSYNWKTPKGLVITPTPALTLPSPTRADSGLYSVSVVVDGCTSMESGAIAVNINPAPQVFATSNSPVCTGDQIQLNATLFPGGNYSWTGPSGFSSALANPSIPNATATINNGFYRVSATVNGCVSNIDSVQVNVNARPNNPPIATNSGPICISNASAALRLSVSPSSALPNAIYTWYNQRGDVIGETQNLNLDLTDFNGYDNGNYLFTVTSKLNGCSSAQSSPTVVVMNKIPSEQAFAGQDKTVCEADSITLNGRQPLSGSGIWALYKGDTTGVRIVSPTLAVSALRGLKGDSTYTFRWTLSNGACANYAFDDVVYKLIPIEIPNAGRDTLVCASDTIRLNAILPISGEGRWSQSVAQQTLGVRISEPLNPQTVIRGLQSGNLYEFTWTIVSGCGGLFDKVSVLTSDTKPNAGADAIVCNEDQSAKLNAATPAAMISDGTWSSPNPKIAFTDPNDPKATAFNLEIGKNTFVWTIDEALCGKAGRDTVVLTYKQNPLAIRDLVAAAFNAKTEFNVLTNDTVPAGTSVRIVIQPQSGNIEALGSGKYSYLPKGNFVGTDELTYEICSEGCDCSSEKVLFQVGGNATCNIPSIITPNGDGVNDFFVIPCFIVDTNYPNNQVSIFNRWGDEVYHSPLPYRNNWDGKFNGQDLPPGTYFYIVTLGDGSEPKSGFVMIQR